jgi:NADPH2:quinone reductase
VAFKGAIAQALREHVWPLIARASRFVPSSTSTFAAADAAQAHALMESNQHTARLF